jgi:hypothetical protein
MQENRGKEWQELETKAIQMLENPRFLPKDETSKNFLPTLHLWISPTFTPEKHWVFYKPQRQLNPQPQPFVRQMIWQKQSDFQRLNNPLIGLQEGFHTEPTFETKTVEIEKQMLENLHQQLSEIRFPAFAKDEILGLDGERFGVEILGFYHQARVSWWSVYPKEWQKLVDWFEKNQRFLEEKFK